MMLFTYIICYGRYMISFAYITGDTYNWNIWRIGDVIYIYNIRTMKNQQSTINNIIDDSYDRDIRNRWYYLYIL